MDGGGLSRRSVIGGCREASFRSASELWRWAAAVLITIALPACQTPRPKVDEALFAEMAAAEADSRAAEKDAIAAGELERRQKKSSDVVDLRRDPANGSVTFWKSANLSAAIEERKGYRELRNRNQFAAMARAFLVAYGSTLALEEAARELEVTRETADDLGTRQVRFRQHFGEVPVRGAELVVHFDREGHVRVVQGHYVPSQPGLDLRPIVTIEAARILAARAAGVSTGGCERCPADLVVYGVGKKLAHLAWEIVVRDGAPSNTSTVLLDAQSAEILEKQPTTGGSAGRRGPLRK